MSNLSQIELTDATVVTLKDNSQTRSDHRHYDTDRVPLVHKVYESTGYYASANDYANASWYFMSIKPDEWGKPWRIKFKVHSYCPSYTSTYQSYTWSTICGRADGFIYANWNERYSSAHSYILLYPLKSAGFTAGYGHALAISIYNADNRTSSAYYRTFEVDLYDTENCTVEFLDTPVKWASWTGGTSTNYGSLAAYNAIDRGLQESGDVNDIENRIIYFAGKTGAKGVWATSLFMEDAYGTYQNICTASDGTVTSSNRTTGTKYANTNGFKVGSPIWFINSNYNANTNISGYGTVYKTFTTFDTRYSFNTTLTAGSLTAYKPLYLVGTIHSDGLYYLDTTWWTQTPTDQSKIYVLVGGVYDSTTSNCRATLYEQNKWFRYDGTQLIEIANDALTVSGHTVATDVPSGAVFTDTKNTAGSTDTSSKIYLIGATEQSVNPQTYSDNQCYVTSGTLQTNILNATAGVNVNTGNSGTAGGLCLYNTTATSYGLLMRKTGSASGELGKHGYVQGDWAIYNTMNSASSSGTRGWIYRTGSDNIASISITGNAVFNGSVTIGGNTTNTSGARMEYNSTTQAVDFIFS